MTQYAVGDIQGCYHELMDCLDQVAFNPSNDCLWVAGDMVNRGPDSLATLQFLYQHRNSVRCVLGNHDLHLLAIYFGHRKAKPSDTAASILDASDSDELIHWLRQQALCIHDDAINFTMAHAGIAPQWTLNEALNYSAEVEAVLKTDAIHPFLINMYGNTPDTWHDDLSGTDRLRCITNYFTRMRICNDDGKLEFTYTGDTNNIPEGYHPWFEQANRKTQQQRIIFGHWAALNGHIDNEHLFGLDTGCVWGQTLTLMQLDNYQLTIAKSQS